MADAAHGPDAEGRRMTDTKQEFLITEVELIYRNPVPASKRHRITSSQDAYDLLMATWDTNKIELLEEFKIILLDQRNACLGISHLSCGGITSSVIDARLVFATAVTARATGIILAHNHPSGSLDPSNTDVAVTHQLAAAGRLLNVKVLDHLIVTSHGYKSLADEGLMIN